MILVDTALRKLADAGTPIRVAMNGAGFMARGIALQIIKSCPGIRLVAIANRHPERAKKVFEAAGVENVYEVEDEHALEKVLVSGNFAVTHDFRLLTDSPSIDVIVEVTGHVESSCLMVFNAILHHKHVVLMNAELDSTVGPILKVYADKNNVIVTNADGDQPGVIMNLYRFVKGLGIKPVLCGNIKAFQDRYRNPKTQKVFADKWGQNPAMITSFTDGTKIAFEQSIVANATGMRVAQRGMLGPVVPNGTTINEAVNWYPREFLSGDGIVDYVVGAAPSPGVFVIGVCEDIEQQKFLDYYKMGSGPLYVFYTPYHLCHLEIPNTIARAFIFHDAACAPLAGPKVDVVATAKINLKKGKKLDDFGHYMTYGLCENSDIVLKEGLLLSGQVEGCRLRRDVLKDQVLTLSDVELPAGRISDFLRAEQNRVFFG